MCLHQPIRVIRGSCPCNSHESMKTKRLSPSSLGFVFLQDLWLPHQTRRQCLDTSIRPTRLSMKKGRVRVGRLFSLGVACLESKCFSRRSSIWKHHTSLNSSWFRLAWCSVPFHLKSTKGSALVSVFGLDVFQGFACPSCLRAALAAQVASRPKTSTGDRHHQWTR